MTPHPADTGLCGKAPRERQWPTSSPLNPANIAAYCDGFHAAGHPAPFAIMPFELADPRGAQWLDGFLMGWRELR